MGRGLPLVQAAATANDISEKWPIDLELAWPTESRAATTCKQVNFYEVYPGQHHAASAGSRRLQEGQVVP